MRHKMYSMRHKVTLYLTILALSLFTASITDGETLISQERPVAIDSFDLSEKTIDEVVAKIKPALVRIFVVAVKYYNGREVKYETAGSGAIITEEGHVITNHHVAGNARQIICTLSNKEEIEADLLGTDPLTDISVLKLYADGKTKFPFAKFGDSSLLKVGDRVLAMGSPFALSQSVTMGIVSNTEIIMPKFLLPTNKLILDGEDVGSIVRWIGHDAPIFGGNSGGPLVNLKGEIVGINEISLGISGAIPGNLAKEVAEKLIRYGRIRRSWFGLEIQPLPRHSKHEKGALVSGAIEGSTAEKAGLLPGDILLKIAGKEVNVQFPEELPIFNQMLMGLPVGEEVIAVVKRNNEEIILPMTPQEREYVMPKNVELKQWGMTARNLSLMLSKTLRRDNQDGVFVTTIRPGGPCWEAKPGIMNDDVIIELNGTPVKNIEELSELTETITKDRSEPLPVIVAFERKKERYLTVVKLGLEKELQDHGFEARKPWIPIAMQVLTKNMAEGLGITGLKGIRITQVYPNSSAARAALMVGDIIIGLNGESINASSPEDYEIFPAMVRQYKIGSIVELLILRDKEKLSVSVELEQSPKLPVEMKKYVDNNFEFIVREVAFMDRAQEDWKEDQVGVLVESVSEGSWASLAKLSVGDLILSVDGKQVPDLASFEKLMKNIAIKKPESVMFQVRRGIHNVFIEIEPNWS